MHFERLTRNKKTERRKDNSVERTYLTAREMHFQVVRQQMAELESWRIHEATAHESAADVFFDCMEHRGCLWKTTYHVAKSTSARHGAA